MSHYTLPFRVQQRKNGSWFITNRLSVGPKSKRERAFPKGSFLTEEQARCLMKTLNTAALMFEEYGKPTN